MSLNEFILTPKEPTKAYYNRYFALVRAYGGFVNNSIYQGLPAALSEQYNENIIILWGDPVEIAGEYNIWQFWRHSSILLGVHSWPGMPEDAEIALFVTIRAPTEGFFKKDAEDNVIYPKVQAFIGSELEEEYEIKDGERSFIIEFDPPPTNTWVWIIIRPVTHYTYGFVKATGHIV